MREGQGDPCWQCDMMMMMMMIVYFTSTFSFLCHFFRGNVISNILISNIPSNANNFQTVPFDP